MKSKKNSGKKVIKAPYNKDLTDESIAILPTLAAKVRELKSDLTWNQVRRLIQSGHILVNGSVETDSRTRINTHAVVSILDAAASNRRSSEETSSNAIKILFLDQHIVVVEKPSGIETVPFTSKNESLISTLRERSATLDQLTRKAIETEERRRIPPLKIVQRLDKGTSGVLVFARTTLAEKKLGQQFKVHSIDRSYLAVVFGVPESKRIETFLVQNRGDGYRGSFHRARSGKTFNHKNDHALGKKAITDLSLIESTNNLSLVRCTLFTGRTHQIRIHLSELGHPLCGDSVYRKPKVGGQTVPDVTKANRIMLHAEKLSFAHPYTGDRLNFDSPFNDKFIELWNDLKKQCSAV